VFLVKPDFLFNNIKNTLRTTLSDENIFALLRALQHGPADPDNFNAMKKQTCG